MNRRRTKDKDLPQRVYVKSNAYFFVPAAPMLVPKTGKVQAWIRLCTVEEGKSVMLRALADLIGSPKTVVGSMPHLCTEFRDNKLGKYSADVRAQYTQYLSVIADEFEEFHASQVTTKEFADFLHDKFSDKANTAKKYAALARKLFKYAISRFGLRTDNPIDQLDLGDFETERRMTLPTHEQVRLIRLHGMSSAPRKGTGLVLPTVSGPMFACLIDMAYLLWARAVDVRMLKESQIVDGHIRIQPSKTQKSSGKTVDFTVTPAIQEVLERARAIKAAAGIGGEYIFPSQKGTPYTKNGLSTMWERARERAGIKEAVWFKDLRALGATDAAKAGKKMADIQIRLAHTSSRTSEIYIKESVPEVSDMVAHLPWDAV